MTHYTNSKGQQVAIADMATPHLRSAHAKAERELGTILDDAAHEARKLEIEAMRVDLERRDAEYQAAQEAEADDAG